VRNLVVVFHNLIIPSEYKIAEAQSASLSEVVLYSKCYRTYFFQSVLVFCIFINRISNRKFVMYTKHLLLLG